MNPELNVQVPIYDNAAVEHQLRADRDEMLAPDFSRVLVIYTGGTIGMKHTPEHGYIPLPNYLAKSLARLIRFHDPSHGLNSRSASQENLADSATLKDQFTSITNMVRQVQPSGETVLTHLPSLVTPVSLFGKRIRYSILEYDPLLDSCNITMDDWVRIARDIEANYEHFDAFIVLHGTDTMAYTASALSFMLEDLGKTVIITGSQVPLTEVRNDAVENLLGALTIAGHFVIPEVCLYFGDKLYRGNRTSKISAVDFDAFDSPNLPALVNLGIDIDVKWPLVLRPTHIAKFKSHKILNRNVASLRLFPGINESTVRAFLAPPLQGVVLETYGAGNAPARSDLLAALKEACDRGVVIVNCTQCRKGLVTDSYATGRQLAAIGVVAGADMTPECALTKLSYLLGKIPDDPQQVRLLMTRNLRGELTARAEKQRFSASGSRSQILLDIFAKVSARSKLAAKSDVDQKVMSLEEEQLAEKMLAPMLLCSAASANDVQSMKMLSDAMGDMLNLNCVDYEGRSPLHIASRDGNIATVEYLLLNGASVHVRDRWGHTPIFVAVVGKHPHVVSMLRKAGAHLSVSEQSDMGPSWLNAVRENDVEFVKIALDAGWPVNWAEAVEGRRAIDVAVCYGRVELLRLLLSQPDCRTDLEDRWGFTVIDKLSWLEKQGRKSIDPEVLKTIAELLRAK